MGEVAGGPCSGPQRGSDPLVGRHRWGCAVPVLGQRQEVGAFDAGILAFHRLGRTAMPLGSLAGAEVLVQGLLHEPVRESKAAEVGLTVNDQAGLYRQVQRMQQIAALHAHDVGHQGELELVAENRRRVEHLDRVGSEASDAPPQRTPHRSRHDSLHGRRVESARGIGQQSQYLVEKERVAAWCGASPWPPHRA